MPKKQIKSASKKLLRIASNLSAGELGWLREYDSHNLKRRAYMDKCADLKKLQQWISEAVHGKQIHRKERIKNYGVVETSTPNNSLESSTLDQNESVERNEVPEVLQEGITTQSDMEVSHEADANEEENTDQNEDQDEDAPSEEAGVNSTQIVIIDLTKRGYDKLIVGQRDSPFTLEHPVVIRARYFTRNARRIVEEQGAICIKVNE